jgi:hypothetical protein
MRITCTDLIMADQSHSAQGLVHFTNAEQERLQKRGIRTWEHEELLLRFFAYVMNKDFRRVKGVSERRKSELFGKPTDGDLFDTKE